MELNISLNNSVKIKKKTLIKSVKYLQIKVNLPNITTITMHAFHLLLGFFYSLF